MHVTIQIHDTRFDGMGFTADEVRVLIAEMLAGGTYNLDEYTRNLSIQVVPTIPINTNAPADPINAL